MTYGLFVLSSKDEKDNACIVNTAVQVASDPTKITVSVQKENLTGEITEAKVLNDEPSCTYAYYHSDIKPKR